MSATELSPSRDRSHDLNSLNVCVVFVRLDGVQHVDAIETSAKWAAYLFRGPPSDEVGWLLSFLAPISNITVSGLAQRSCIAFVVDVKLPTPV